MKTQPVEVYGVFYLEVDGKGKNSADPIAINIHVEGQKASWRDTRHGHTIHLKEWKKLNENSYEFIDKEGAIYRLSPLTLEIFNDKIKNSVVPMDKAFQSDEELRLYYQQTNFYS